MHLLIHTVKERQYFPPAQSLLQGHIIPLGKYEFRPAVKKFVSVAPQGVCLRVSVASRVVNPSHDELRPAVSKELYQLRPTVCASCLLVASRFVNWSRMSCIVR